MVGGRAQETRAQLEATVKTATEVMSRLKNAEASLARGCAA